MKRLTLALFTLVVATVSWAQQPGFTLEQVMSSPFPKALTAAAKANRIAWVFNSKGERNVWIADAPEFAGRQVTHYQGDNGQDIYAVKLTPDGKTVLYARGSELNDEGRVANPTSEIKEPKQQVWAADVETGKTRLIGEMGCPEEDCEDIQISPDGQWAVWVGVKRRLWIAGVAEGKAAHQLTELRGEEGEPQWSPDGRHIAFSSERRDHGFVAIADLDESGTAQRVRYVAPSVDRDFAPRWSPDGKQLVFLRVPGAENHLPLIPRRPRPWSIWLANVETDASHPEAARGAGAVEARGLWHSGKAMNDSLPPFAAESLKFTAGGRIVFCSEQDGRNHLYMVLPGVREAVLLTPGEFDVEDVELTPDKMGILYTSNKNDVDRRHIWGISFWGIESGKNLYWGETRPLTGGAALEWHPLMLADGKTVVCLGSSATSPAMPYYLTGEWPTTALATKAAAWKSEGERLAVQGRRMIAAGALPKDFPSGQLVEPQSVTFRSEDGLEIHGQLFVPRGRKPGTALPSQRGESRSAPGPAIIHVHGGPPRQMMPGFHYSWYYHNAYAENQYLASLGYVVLTVNYRLGIMYGRAFREAPNSGWRGSAEYKDVVAGARYLQSLPYVDRKRIGIWGGSYGGLLTALALARNSDIFAAGVDFHGVHDWSMLLRRRENGAEPPDLQDAIKLAFDSSPVASTGGWRSPVLLIHGDDDRNVPFSQTTDLVQRLRQQNVEFEEIVFPDEIHDFLLWKSWVQAYRATAEFFGKRFGVGQGK
jgi:dipeptidyl aminopeptidase/acylaminoacyl peptidase